MAVTMIVRLFFSGKPSFWKDGETLRERLSSAYKSTSGRRA